MTLERDMQAAARGVGDDLRVIGTELSGLLLRAWPITLLLAAYLYLALRTSAGWTGAAILMGLAVLILAVPLGPRMLRRWRKQRVVAAWTTAVASVGLPPSRVERVEYRDTGERLHVRVTGGIAVDDLGGKVRQLEAALGARVRIGREQPGCATVTILRREPRVVGVWPGAKVAKPSIWDPVPLGVDEDDQPVGLSLVGRHLLVGGQTGGGKSVTLSAICAWAVCDPEVRLYLLDAKRLELAVWKGSADAFIGPDLNDATALLQEIRRELDRRTDELEARSEREGIPIRKITRDLGLPLHVIIIDELAEYTDRGKESAEFSSTLRSLVSLGRAVGIVVVAATQKPQASVVPSELRDLFPCRFALRCGTPQMSETILGQGWASRGADASRLPEQPGLGFLLADEATPRRVQTYYLSDDDLATLARRAGERRTSALLRRVT